MLGSSYTAKGPKGKFRVTKAFAKPRRAFFSALITLLTVDNCSPPEQAQVLPTLIVSCSAMRVYSIFKCLKLVKLYCSSFLFFLISESDEQEYLSDSSSGGSEFFLLLFYAAILLN